MACFDDHNTAVQSQKAVSAYFTSKQILPFGFAEQNSATLMPMPVRMLRFAITMRKHKTMTNDKNIAIFEKVFILPEKITSFFIPNLLSCIIK